MLSHEYIALLNERLKNHFQIDYNTEVMNNKFDMFAKCNLVLGRTFISQQDIIDRYESNEYVLTKTFDTLTEKDMDDIIQFLKELPEFLVKPHKEHKSSFINAVVVCNDHPDKNIIEKVQSFKLNKTYKFYFHGFCELRLILVSLKDSIVVFNKAARSVKKVYLPTP